MIGRTIGNYRVTAKLGAGGMGEVWRAEHAHLPGRVHALKTLPEGFSRNAVLVERFRREAVSMASLDHPHIVKLHDFGVAPSAGKWREEKTYYFVMELVEGPALARILRGNEGRCGALEVGRAVEIALAVCDALSYARERGVVHRDIKPSNLLLDPEGRVKVSDFGLARILGDMRRTASGRLVTASEAAPEARQNMAQGVSPRCSTHR